jgi:pyruvate dehydrogenase E2 component (dihydrolipoamide acetyltransferase)
VATEFILPELGENIDSADVVDVLVSVGDQVKIDDPILEIETDKATFEVPSTVNGVIKELMVQAGESAKVGQVVMVVEETDGADAEGQSDSGDAPQADSQEASEEKQSDETDDSKEAAGRSEDEERSQQEPEESRRATAVSDAPTEPRGNVDLSAPGGSAPEEPSPNGISSGPRELVPAAPSTRRLAREIGVDINQVKGSGPQGRISIDDVKNHAKSLLGSGGGGGARTAPSAPSTAPAVKLPDFTKFGEVTREKMSNVRRATANQMHLNWSTIPMVTQFDKADITDLETLRKQLNKQSSGGAKITVTAILLKVLASALKKFPQFNASIDMANEEIVYKSYFNVAVAVDTERGLLVPVVRNVDQRNVKELAADLDEIAEKARSRKIRPEDFQGSCMTISNLGGIGGVGFTPIVNSPEVAILGVSRASMEPVYQDETFYARLMMPICVSYDHRLIDGADAARFLRWVCRALENPALLAFEG